MNEVTKVIKWFIPKKLRFALNKGRSQTINFRNMLRGLPPVWSDLVGYESLLSIIKKYRVFKLDGDIVEIGSFLGGGTAKLAKFFLKYGKKIYTIDVFNPSFDLTMNLSGHSMASLYKKYLKGENQWEVFQKVTKKYPNIVVLKGDSKKVNIPADKLCFSFIDGCHDPDYVKNDFYLVWGKTVSNGIISFHDYDGDLSQTTAAIDSLIEVHRDQIKRLVKIEKKWILLIFRR